MEKPDVLVIAKEASTQDTFQTILADEFEHLAAFNSVDGVAISRLTKPAIVFVDVQIPHLQATGVCKTLLSDESVRTIPVVVLGDTAAANGELKALSNFRGVLPKPIQAEQVKARIHEAIEKGAPAAGQAAQPTAAKREGPIRVLSVDDSSVVRKLVTMILTAEGFKVTTASDGLDGINKAKELKPDVILLDFVMPKMNGFQVCRILQKDDALKQIPVILVTSKGDKVGDKFVNQLGVVGYITKPFQPEELVSKIHQTLEAGQAQQQAVGPEAPAAPAAPPQAAAPGVSPAPAAAAAAPQAPAAASPDAVRAIVQEEVTRALEQALEEKVQKLIKAEVSQFTKNLDKRIEKLVVEKINQYIRRAKKK